MQIIAKPSHILSSNPRLICRKPARAPKTPPATMRVSSSFHGLSETVQTSDSRETGDPCLHINKDLATTDYFHETHAASAHGGNLFSYFRKGGQEDTRRSTLGSRIKRTQNHDLLLRRLWNLKILVESPVQFAFRPIPVVICFRDRPRQLDVNASATCILHPCLKCFISDSRQILFLSILSDSGDH